MDKKYFKNQIKFIVADVVRASSTVNLQVHTNLIVGTSFEKTSMVSKYQTSAIIVLDGPQSSTTAVSAADNSSANQTTKYLITCPICNITCLIRSNSYTPTQFGGALFGSKELVSKITATIFSVISLKFTTEIVSCTSFYQYKENYTRVYHYNSNLSFYTADRELVSKMRYNLVKNVLNLPNPSNNPKYKSNDVIVKVPLISNVSTTGMLTKCVYFLKAEDFTAVKVIKELRQSGYILKIPYRFSIIFIYF